MLAQLSRAALTPLWAAQLLTGTKSFERNPVIGSRWLNEHGLHAARVRLAQRIAETRRRVALARQESRTRSSAERNNTMTTQNATAASAMKNQTLPEVLVTTLAPKDCYTAVVSIQFSACSRTR